MEGGVGWDWKTSLSTRAPVWITYLLLKVSQCGSSNFSVRFSFKEWSGEVTKIHMDVRWSEQYVRSWMATRGLQWALVSCSSDSVFSHNDLTSERRCFFEPQKIRLRTLKRPCKKKRKKKVCRFERSPGMTFSGLIMISFSIMYDILKKIYIWWELKIGPPLHNEVYSHYFGGCTRLSRGACLHLPPPKLLIRSSCDSCIDGDDSREHFNILVPLMKAGAL